MLYLRDVMAAGDEVVHRIEGDLTTMTAASHEAREAIRHGASHVDLLLRGALRRYLSEAARMMMERDRSISPAVASADVEGHLTYLHELLADALGRKSH